jgi:3-oxoacyl-[acyl-carrier protein] reductase
MSMFDLSGRTALVTGASGAIGAAIATALHSHGANLILSGTRRDALDLLAGQLPDRVAVIACNLAEPSAVEQLGKDAEAAFGTLDILVNNAGLTRDGLAVRMKDEDWQAVLDVDLTACFRLSRTALRGMMKRRFGRIVNITSIVGVTGNPGQVNYAAAKAGLIGMSKALAQEVAQRGITVNCIAPGFVTSAMTDVLSDDVKSRLLAGIPLGRMGEPQEIGAAALYLASNEAAYVTGQTLHVNGGMAMI